MCMSSSSATKLCFRSRGICKLASLRQGGHLDFDEFPHSHSSQCITERWIVFIHPRTQHSSAQSKLSYGDLLQVQRQNPICHGQIHRCPTWIYIPHGFPSERNQHFLTCSRGLRVEIPFRMESSSDINTNHVALAPDTYTTKTVGSCIGRTRGGVSSTFTWLRTRVASGRLPPMYA